MAGIAPAEPNHSAVRPTATPASQIRPSRRTVALSRPGRRAPPREPALGDESARRRRLEARPIGCGITAGDEHDGGRVRDSGEPLGHGEPVEIRQVDGEQDDLGPQDDHGFHGPPPSAASPMRRSPRPGATPRAEARKAAWSSTMSTVGRTPLVVPQPAWLTLWSVPIIATGSRQGCTQRRWPGNAHHAQQGGAVQNCS